MTEQATETRTIAPIEGFKNNLQKYATEFESALPSHISPEQFQRVAVTAVNTNLELLGADKQSLMNSLMMAAQDGLLPDGREGALVIYNTKQGNGWIKKVQWLPMIGGVLAKIRRSGELSSITAQVKYSGDEFDYWIDDDGEHLNHRPAFGSNRGELELVYALAKTKDGGVYIEVIDKPDLLKIKGCSKTGDKGPWKDWFEQMAKKSALHRLSKRLPISSEIMDVIRRDDELYDFSKMKDVTPQPKQMQTLEQVVSNDDAEDLEADE